jgi:hypothetical protein
MAILGASGQKAATYLQPGRIGYALSAQNGLEQVVGCTRYDYTPSGAKDVLNVSGSGVLQFGFFIGSSTSSTNSNVKITIDGTIVLNETKSANIYTEGMIQVGSLYFYNGNYSYITSDVVPYNESLVINVTCNNAAYYYYRYYKS